MKIIGINEYKIYRAVVELADGSQREFDIDPDSAMLFARELVLEAQGMSQTPPPAGNNTAAPPEPMTPVPGMVQLNPDEQQAANDDGLYEGMDQDESVGPEGSGSI